MTQSTSGDTRVGESHGVDIQALYRDAYGFVFTKARRMLGDEDEAKDVTQEVFVRAMKHSKKLARSPSQVGWLLVCTTRLCLDLLRHRKVVSAHGQAQMHPAADDPEIMAGARHFALHLLRGLPMLTQLIAVHVFLDEMTQEETALVLGISRKTVQRHLDRFRAHCAQGKPGPPEAEDG